MKIVFYVKTFARHHVEASNMFHAGLKRHGFDCVISDFHTYLKADLAVMWGVRNEHILELQRKNGLDTLIMELGYFGDRKEYTSIGYGGLNGRADFLNSNMPSDRWDKHGVELGPWKDNGEFYALMGQVPGDMSIKHIDVEAIYADVASHAQKYPKKIYFKPHPLAGNNIERMTSTSRDLEDVLRRAQQVITINSNSGVDAVLAGVPTIALDEGSMAWDVAGHSLTETGYMPDREQWAHNLAYCQWTKQEIEDGDAWQHLKRKFD